MHPLQDIEREQLAAQTSPRVQGPVLLDDSTEDRAGHRRAVSTFCTRDSVDESLGILLLERRRDVRQIRVSVDSDVYVRRESEVRF